MAAAAERLPADILRTIQGFLPLVDYLRFPAVCAAWRSASRDRQKLDHLPRGPPWLFTLSYNDATLYAVDCISNISAPKVYRIPLPDHLHGHDLFSSVGHCLLFEKRGSLSGIRLFSPFSSPYWTQVACQPPSASFTPPYHISPEVCFYYQIYAVVTDTNTGIAVALMSQGERFLSYARLDCKAGNSDNGNPGSSWINLTHLIPDPHINSGSSLFLVRWRNILKDYGVNRRKEIDVYRLDDDDGAHGGKHWVPVKSLGDLSFFIGDNQSISLSTLDFPDLRSNRVYLPFDATTRIAGDQFNCPSYKDDRDFGYHIVYDMEDESWGGVL